MYLSLFSYSPQIVTDESEDKIMEVDKEKEENAAEVQELMDYMEVSLIVTLK
jgi:hypothetical protein